MPALAKTSKSNQNQNQNQNNSGQSAADTQSSTLVDNRPATLAQMKLADGIGNGPGAKKTAQLQDVIGRSAPVQKKENSTGLPDNLKSGVENLSGVSLDDVKVHTNSDQPAQMQAHAFAQGTDIHVAPGQEQHLPHEAWHVVQQKQGRVKPTTQMKGEIPVNDDKGLEHEADVMGAKALSLGNSDQGATQLKSDNDTGLNSKIGSQGSNTQLRTKNTTSNSAPIQMVLGIPDMGISTKLGFDKPKKDEKFKDAKSVSGFEDDRGDKETKNAIAKKGGADRQDFIDSRSDDFSELNDLTIGLSGTLTGDLEEGDKKYDPLSKISEKDSKTLDTASKITDIAGPVLSMVSDMHALYYEEDKWKQLELTGSIAGDIAEITAASASLAAGDKKNDYTAGVTAAVSGVFTTVANLYSGIKKGYEAWKESDPKKAGESMKNILAAAKSGAETAVGIMETINKTVPPAVQAFIPPVGIAIGSLELIMGMYDFYKGTEGAAESRNIANDYQKKLPKNIYEKVEAGYFFGKEHYVLNTQVFDDAIEYRKNKEISKKLKDLKPSTMEMTDFVNLLLEFDLASKEVEMGDDARKGASISIGLSLVNMAADVAALVGGPGGLAVSAGIKTAVAAGKGLAWLGKMGYSYLNSDDIKAADAKSLRKAVEHTKTIFNLYTDLQAFAKKPDQEEKANEKLEVARKFVKNAGLGVATFESSKADDKAEMLVANFKG